MGLDWVRVSLRGYGGEQPTGTLFFDHLGLEPDSGFVTSPSNSPWQAAAIELVEVTFEESLGFPEPAEEFASRIECGLIKAAEWLVSKPVELFNSWRNQGHEADIFVGGWLEGEQFGFSFPAAFLLACGRAGLPIEICTND